MALGKPVIATAWSGNLDFMSKRNSALVSYSLVPVNDPQGVFDVEGQMWADARVDDAAKWLRRLAESPELRRDMGATAAADVKILLAPERFARRVAELVEVKNDRLEER
jgi:glycosyltransferase involved in cell wall biosynthesis